MLNKQVLDKARAMSRAHSKSMHAFAVLSHEGKIYLSLYIYKEGTRVDLVFIHCFGAGNHLDAASMMADYLNTARGLGRDGVKPFADLFASAATSRGAGTGLAAHIYP